MEKSSMVWKLMQLLLILEQSPGLPGAELAERCEMSLRSIYRYVNLLRMAGVPLICDRGYRIDQKLSLKAINLTLSQAFSLVLAGQHFSRGKTPFDATLNEALEKILTVLPEGLRKSTLDSRTHILMGRESPIDYTQSRAVFNQVETAVNNRTVVEIGYKGLRNGRVGERLVDPYGMVFRQGFWYLVARCHRRNEELLFRLDRIINLKTTEETFEPPADFSLAEYMKDAWQVVRGEPRLIEVRFHGVARRIVLEGKWHPSQKVLADNDAGLLVSYRIGGLQEIAAWLLGFGGEAEVVEPVELRQLVAETALAAAARNQVRNEAPAKTLRGAYSHLSEREEADFQELKSRLKSEA